MAEISRRGWLLGMGRILIASLPAAAALAGSAADPAESLSEQVNDEGGVSVAVKPLTLAPSATAWRFAVQLNTHMFPLDQDLVQVAGLSGDGSQTEAPTAWDGDGPGGHHRKGVLRFRPFNPPPPSLTLTIRAIGDVAARSFTWKLASP